MYGKERKLSTALHPNGNNAVKSVHYKKHCGKCLKVLCYRHKGHNRCGKTDMEKLLCQTQISVNLFYSVL